MMSIWFQWILTGSSNFRTKPLSIYIGRGLNVCALTDESSFDFFNLLFGGFMSISSDLLNAGRNYRVCLRYDLINNYCAPLGFLKGPRLSSDIMALQEWRVNADSLLALFPRLGRERVNLIEAELARFQKLNLLISLGETRTPEVVREFCDLSLVLSKKFSWICNQLIPNCSYVATAPTSIDEEGFVETIVQ